MGRMESIPLTRYARHVVDISEACYCFLLLTDPSRTVRRDVRSDADWRALLEALQEARPTDDGDASPSEIAALVTTLDALTRTWTVDTLQRSMTGRFAPGLAEEPPRGHTLASALARRLARLRSAHADYSAPFGIWARLDRLPDVLFVEFEDWLLPIRASHAGLQRFRSGDVEALQLSRNGHLRFASTGTALDLVAHLKTAAKVVTEDGLLSKRVAHRCRLDLQRYDLLELT